MKRGSVIVDRIAILPLPIANSSRGCVAVRPPNSAGGGPPLASKRPIETWVDDESMVNNPRPLFPFPRVLPLLPPPVSEGEEGQSHDHEGTGFRQACPRPHPPSIISSTSTYHHIAITFCQFVPTRLYNHHLAYRNLDAHLSRTNTRVAHNRPLEVLVSIGIHIWTVVTSLPYPIRPQTLHLYTRKTATLVLFVSSYRTTST